MSQGTGGNSQSTKTTCWKCGLVCKNRQGLSVHQNKCLSNATKGASFFTNERITLNRLPERNQETTTEKVLPESQPLLDETIQQQEQTQPENTRRESTNPNYNRQPTIPEPPPPPPSAAQTARPGAQNEIWGSHSADDLTQIVSGIYEEIVYWRKNLFKLPSGAAGKSFIKETTKLISMWNEGRQPMYDISLKMVMIMPALLLQKPTRNSTAKQHGEYLKKRLNLWTAGHFDELKREGAAIQEQLKNQQRRDETQDHTAKVFAKLMMQGKVHAALRLLDKAASLGVAELTDETMKALANLHPAAKPANEQILKTGELPYFDPVIFTNINEQSIAKAANKTRGAAGPSGLDAEGWRRILISRNYGLTGKELRTALAKMTQTLCTQSLPETSNKSIEPYIANRLIPLLKAPSGIRPIGIGEVLRRIIGKAVITEIKPEIMESSGCLQLCGGQKAGCEAAAHAMRDIFDEEETDAVLFIDASNAFNSLNRKALLHNIRYLCPAMATYIHNCYQQPSRLFIAGGKELQSAEGTTQGDPTAMPAYGVGILPFLSLIKSGGGKGVKQLAYADDIGGGAKIRTLREWWSNIEEHGPSFGYYPKASKSWLVVKEDKYEEALEVFNNTGINITTQGRKYLGGYVGTKEGAEEYVSELRDDWINQLKELTKIASSQPQAAYSAFVFGFQHKMTYFIRTIPHLCEILRPLDEYITNYFLPAITEGHVLSEADRKLLSLPVRFGGIGIPIYEELCTREYENSRKVTSPLTPKIVAQEEQYVYDKVREKKIDAEIKKVREEAHALKLGTLRSSMTPQQIRANDLSQLKGASAWLTSLPLKEEGFSLNKREFFDAITLRNRWNLKRVPTHCQCKKSFDSDHAMQCMLGGYVTRRHNRIRDLVAKLLNSVAHGVQIEPPLQSLTGEALEDTANQDNESRLDVAARGFWQEYEMAFFDIRVFNPFAKSYMNANQSLDAVFNKHETEKKKQYNQRVIQIEHGSFTPFVVSSYGGFGRETSMFISRLVEKIAEKNGMEVSDVSNYIRTKLSYQLVRSQVACIRGSRSLFPLTGPIDTNEIEVVNKSARIGEEQ